MARRSKSYKFSDFVVDGKPTFECWQYLSNLSNAVVFKYYYKYLNYFEHDDLVSLATLDAVAFAVKIFNLNSGDAIKNIRNVFFTRIRNTLSNFVFRSNKLVSTEDDILDHCIVYPKSNEIKSDLIKMDDLLIDSIDNFRTVSLKTWNLYKLNNAKQHYAINSSNDDISDWNAYSEVRNMKTPCDLLSIYDKYTDDQIEQLANKLDTITGQNYFNTLYQLLGDKFLAFLDVFQEDKFNIPSTAFVKHLLTDMAICDDFSDGLSVDDLSDKYNKSSSCIQKIINAKEVI
jgi:hypothetical protein